VPRYCETRLREPICIVTVPLTTTVSPSTRPCTSSVLNFGAGTPAGRGLEIIASRSALVRLPPLP
jgi:hypothetical protein